MRIMFIKHQNTLSRIQIHQIPLIRVIKSVGLVKKYDKNDKERNFQPERLLDLNSPSHAIYLLTF